MAWHNWVLRKFSGAESPEEWVSIVTELKTILDDKLIDKIEFAAFVIRGSRKARWTISENDPEYSSELNSMDAAKRLTQLLISSKEGPTITNSLKILLNLPEQKITKCPMCNNEIIISDFYKDGRRDPYSIQMGHKIPLSRLPHSHNGENVFWAHRVCNFMQGDRTMEEVLQGMKEVLLSNGFTVEKTQKS